MDYYVTLDYTEQHFYLSVDDKFCNNDSDEKSERKKYKLYKKENIGMVILGKESNKNYITVISDRRFVMIENRTNRYQVHWKNLKLVSLKNENLIFKTFSDKTKMIPISRLSCENKDLEDIGKWILKIIRQKIKQNAKNNYQQVP